MMQAGGVAQMGLQGMGIGGGGRGTWEGMAAPLLGGGLAAAGGFIAGDSSIGQFLSLESGVSGLVDVLTSARGQGGLSGILDMFESWEDATSAFGGTDAFSGFDTGGNMGGDGGSGMGLSPFSSFEKNMFSGDVGGGYDVPMSSMGRLSPEGGSMGRGEVDMSR